MVRANVEAAVGRFVERLGAAGHAGIWFEHLASGDVVQLNADEVFPAASVIKVPILVAAYGQIEAGKLDLDAISPVPASAKIAGSGVLKELHPGLEVTVRDLLTLMIIVSDNTATNMVIDLVGLDEVNRVIRDFGLKHTWLRRLLVGGTFSDRPDNSLAIDNTVTASETGSLLRRLVDGRASCRPVRGLRTRPANCATCAMTQAWCIRGTVRTMSSSY